MKQQPEYQLQVAICTYITLQYPHIMFMSDTIASCRLTVRQQTRNRKIQKNGFHCPDLIIFEPKNQYCGLFLELKVVTPFKKNGELKAGDHLKNQQNTIKALQLKGYKAHFSWGFEMTKCIIDSYLNQ